MGPLRGGLILTFLASPALAEVCDKERPNWDGTPQTLLDEALFHFASPIGLFLLAALAVAVIFRHAMGTAIVVLLWSFYISAITLPDQSDVSAFVVAEGCMGSPSLYIVLSAVLSIAAVFYTFKGRANS